MNTPQEIKDWLAPTTPEGKEIIISLEKTIEECLKNPELLEQYERLNPRKIYLLKKKNIEYHEKYMHKYFDFIRDYIWKPIILSKYD